MKMAPRVTFHDYYWGNVPSGSACFRSDINRLVPDDRKRTRADDTKFIVFSLHLLFEGGPASYLEGRHRDYFLIALFFTALIDQGMHHYYHELHGEYDRLTAPPKLCMMVDNVHPEALFLSDHGWSSWTKERLEAFREAKSVFKEGFLAFAAHHFPTMDARSAWDKFCGHLPMKFTELDRN